MFIPGIMEHLEKAGIHSGDSISIYPPQSISREMKDKILKVTADISIALEVMGMINIQFIEFENELYIIEVNPRSSRTVPYISKVTGVPIIEVATKVMLGERLKDLGYNTEIYKEPDFVTVKVPVFSTEKLPQVEATLGPEMRSTGEVLGIGKTLEEAFYKGFVGSGMKIPEKNCNILVTLRRREQKNFIPLAKRFEALGCNFIATEGTANTMQEAGIDVKTVKKIGEGVPNILDTIRSGIIDFVVDIPSKSNDINSDAFRIRRAAIEGGTKLMTSLDTVEAVLRVMEKKISADGVDIYPIGR